MSFPCWRILETFIYNAEDSPQLRLLGRVAIATRDAALLDKAKGAFEDLWERRAALQLEEEGPDLPEGHDVEFEYVGDLESYGYWVDGPSDSQWVQHRPYW